MPGFLSPGNCEIIDVCCFKPLKFGVICYSATDNEHVIRNCNMSLPHFMPTTHFSLLTTIHYILYICENSLVVQWLRLCTPNAGGLGSIPGQGTRSHMAQLKTLHAHQRLKIMFVTTNAWHSQINKLKKKKEKTKNNVNRKNNNCHPPSFSKNNL